MRRRLSFAASLAIVWGMRASVTIALISAALAACGGAAAPSVEPGEGAFIGGDPLSIRGEGFAGRGPVTVYICQRSAKGVIVEGDRLIRLRTPRADEAGTCDLRIEFGDGDSVTLGGAFTYAVPTGDEEDDPFDQLARGG